MTQHKEDRDIPPGGVQSVGVPTVEDPPHDAPYVPARILAVTLVFGVISTITHATALLEAGNLMSFDGLMQFVMGSIEAWAAWRMWFGTRRYLLITTLVLGSALIYLWGNVWMVLSGQSAAQQLHWMGITAAWFPLIYVGAYLWCPCHRATIFSLVCATGMASMVFYLRDPNAGVLAAKLDSVAIGVGLAQFVTVGLFHGLGMALQRIRFGRMRLVRLTTEASSDSLTGLPNRRALVLRMQALLSDEAQPTPAPGATRNPMSHLARLGRTEAVQGAPAALIMLHPDQFRRVQDQHSHFLAEQVLLRLAGLLRGFMPDGCTAGRWGSETFLIACPGWSLEQAMRLAERIRQAMESTDWQGLPYAVTASFGVAPVLAGDDLSAVVRRVDLALSSARVAGGNTVCRQDGQARERATGASSAMIMKMRAAQPGLLVRLMARAVHRVSTAWSGPVRATDLARVVTVSPVGMGEAGATEGSAGGHAPPDRGHAAVAVERRRGAQTAADSDGSPAAGSTGDNATASTGMPAPDEALTGAARLSSSLVRVLFIGGALSALLLVRTQEMFPGYPRLSQALLVLLACGLLALALARHLPKGWRQNVGAASALLFALHEVVTLSSGLIATPDPSEQITLMGVQNAWIPAMYVAIFLAFGLRAALLVSAVAFFAVLATVRTFALPVADPALTTASSMITSYITLGHFNLQLNLVVLGLLQIYSARQERTASHLAETARIDPLTGLLTRAAIGRELPLQMKAACQPGGGPLALLLIDMDDLKRLSDTHGHVKGDAVLVRMAQCLQEDIRASGVAARWSGEQFMVLTRPCTQDDAGQLAQRVLRTMRTLDWPVPEAVRASIGVAIWSPGDSVELLLRRADEALYEARRRGGARTEVRTVLDVPLFPSDAPGVLPGRPGLVAPV